VRTAPILAALLLLSACTDYEQMARNALEDDYDQLTLEPGDDAQTFAFSGVDRDSGEDCSGSVHVEGSESRSTSRVTATCRLPDDPARLETSCRDGHAAACARVARDLRDSDAERALELASIGCRAGDGSACFQAGVIEERRSESTRAHGFYQRGCDAGVRAACFNTAVCERTGTGTEVNLGQARRRFTTLCEEEGQLRDESCAAAAELLIQGAGTAPDHPLAMTMAQRSCEAEHPPACALVAFLLIDGDGVPHDHARAHRAAQTACEGEVGMGCRLVGILERDGLGRPADAAAARRWFERGCAHEDAYSCQQRDALGT